MKLEDQACSLELSKKLKDLGVKQESLFYWYSFDELPFHILYENETPIVNRSIIYSAFTVSELGEILPKYTSSARGDDDNYIWECIHDCGNGYFSTSGAETEADSRAKMLIYLIQNGLIKND